MAKCYCDKQFMKSIIMSKLVEVLVTDSNSTRSADSNSTSD